jgi:hypothetical protein
MLGFSPCRVDFSRGYYEEIQDRAKNNTAIQISLVAIPCMKLFSSFASDFLDSGLRSWVFSQNVIEAFHKGEKEAILFQSFHLAVAVSALAGAIFFPQVGKMLITGQDLFADLFKLQRHVQEANYDKMIEDVFRISCKSSYLVFLATGGFQAEVALLALNVLFNLYQVEDAVKKENLELAVGKVLGLVFSGYLLRKCLNREASPVSFLDPRVQENFRWNVSFDSLPAEFQSALVNGRAISQEELWKYLLKTQKVEGMKPEEFFKNAESISVVIQCPTGGKHLQEIVISILFPFS